MGEKVRVARDRIAVFFGRRRNRVLVISLAVTGAIALWGPWTYAVVSTAGRRYDSATVRPGEVPARRVAIVFGARVNGDEPTPYVRYRVEAAAALYKAGRVQKLLMTGDNSRDDYNEPAVMRQTAIDLGVPAAAIVVDDAGFSTYDSCYRARHIFGVTSAIVVTQNYHLPRAVFACKGVGIDSIGYGARQTHPLLIAQYTAREWVSNGKIVIQLLIGAHSRYEGPPITTLQYH